MTRDQLVEIARRWVDAANRGDRAAQAALLHPCFVQHTPGLPPGPQAALWAIALFRGGFPDLQTTLDWVMVDGDRVVYRATTRGTHAGTFLGHAPTHRSFTATSLDALRIADGVIAERWTEFDTLAMLQQLGLVPARSGP